MTNKLIIEKAIPVNAAEKVFSKHSFSPGKKENSLYTDDEVMLLPVVEKGNPLYKEWCVRKASCKRLQHYLKRKQFPLRILEVGCGNGWLSAQLASLKNVTVTGIDVNGRQLKQAQRVFAAKKNLNFMLGELDTAVLKDTLFDVIVMAASVQYFPSVKKIIKKALAHLTLQGEIHIMDSVFCQRETAVQASHRSQESGMTVNFPQLQEYCYRHDIDSLQHFNYTVLYNPASLITRLMPGRSPFYHIIIKAKGNRHFQTPIYQQYPVL